MKFAHITFVKYCTLYIDLFHNDSHIKHCSVLMLISLSSLTSRSKSPKNICFKMRAVASNLQTAHTKKCKGSRYYFMKVVYMMAHVGTANLSHQVINREALFSRLHHPIF